jgi:hypothetical protein
VAEGRVPPRGSVPRPVARAGRCGSLAARRAHGRGASAAVAVEKAGGDVIDPATGAGRARDHSATR